MEDKNDYTALEGVLKLEQELYEDTSMTFETKATMYWGALIVAHRAKQFDWDDQRRLFGEFCSKALGLR